jgi:hypothetical protein
VSALSNHFHKPEAQGPNNLVWQVRNSSSHKLDFDVPKDFASISEIIVNSKFNPYWGIGLSSSMDSSLVPTADHDSHINYCQDFPAPRNQVITTNKKHKTLSAFMSSNTMNNNHCLTDYDSFMAVGAEDFDVVTIVKAFGTYMNVEHA